MCNSRSSRAIWIDFCLLKITRKQRSPKLVLVDLLSLRKCYDVQIVLQLVAVVGRKAGKVKKWKSANCQQEPLSSSHKVNQKMIKNKKRQSLNQRPRAKVPPRTR